MLRQPDCQISLGNQTLSERKKLQFLLIQILVAPPYRSLTTANANINRQKEWEFMSFDVVSERHITVKQRKTVEDFISIFLPS